MITADELHARNAIRLKDALDGLDQIGGTAVCLVAMTQSNLAVIPLIHGMEDHDIRRMFRGLADAKAREVAPCSK